MPTMQLLLIKTRPENMAGVIRAQKHALAHHPKTLPSLGDPIVIAETATDTRPPGFRFVARFFALYEAPEVADEIWGKDRRYVLEWRDRQDFLRPIGTQDLVQPSVNYDRIQVHGYLRESDIEQFREMDGWPEIISLQVPGDFRVEAPSGSRFVCLNCKEGLYGDLRACPACDAEWTPVLQWTDIDDAVRQGYEPILLWALNRSDHLTPWDRRARELALAGASRNEIAEAQVAIIKQQLEGAREPR